MAQWKTEQRDNYVETCPFYRVPENGCFIAQNPTSAETPRNSCRHQGHYKIGHHTLLVVVVVVVAQQ